MPAIIVCGGDAGNWDKMGTRGYKEWFDPLALLIRARLNEEIHKLYKKMSRKPTITVVGGFNFIESIPAGSDGYHLAKGEDNLHIYRMANFIHDCCMLAILLAGPTP